MRSIVLLQALADAPDGASVRQFAETTGMSRSTVHRLLQGLADAKLAEQVDGGRYRMGPRLFELAALVLSRSSLVRVADSLMKELVDRTGETAYIAVLAGDRRSGVHVHRVDSPEPLRYLVPRGSRFPLHAGAAGKVMLAFMGPPWELDDLEPITAGTVTDRDLIEPVLLQIRDVGYSITSEERVRGAAGVAAPLIVRDEVVGSLTLSVPVARAPAEGLEVFAPVVVEYAARISMAVSVLGRAELDHL